MEIIQLELFLTYFLLEMLAGIAQIPTCYERAQNFHINSSIDVCEKTINGYNLKYF